MWSLIFEAVLGALKAILGLGGKPKDPSATELSASDATAQTELAQQEATNVILENGAEARTAAGTRIVFGDDGPPNAVNLNPAAAVNASPDAHFRD